VIIKDAKRIFNSDKICDSYCDFYFGVTFLEHTVVKKRTNNYVSFVESIGLLALNNSQCVNYTKDGGRVERL